MINANFLVINCARWKITGKRSTGFGNVSDVVILLSINNLLTSMVVVLENGITIVFDIHFIPLISILSGNVPCCHFFVEEMTLVKSVLTYG